MKTMKKALSLCLAIAVLLSSMVFVLPSSVAATYPQELSNGSEAVSYTQSDALSGKYLVEVDVVKYSPNISVAPKAILSEAGDITLTFKPNNGTAPELREQLGKKIDIYVSGIGSGGTLQGIARYILDHNNPDCRIVAVEPKGVSALLGDEPGLHQIQGIGDGFVPDVLDTSMITDIITVSDDDAINTARDLARNHGLLVGTSSGANIWAAKQMAEKYGKDKVIATVLPDRAERYFSTSLF